MRAALALLLVCPGLARADEVDQQLRAMTGKVWWYDPATNEGCAEWTFVRQDWGVSLERRWTETGDGWAREVRVFHNIAVEGEALIAYAPGWESEWIVEPDGTTGAPAEMGALGCVSGFCLLDHDARRLTWVETWCGSETEQTPRGTWFRRRSDCEADVPAGWSTGP